MPRSNYNFTIFCADSLPALSIMPSSDCRDIQLAIVHADNREFNKQLQNWTVDFINTLCSDEEFEFNRREIDAVCQTCAKVAQDDTHVRDGAETHSSTAYKEEKGKVQRSRIYKLEWFLAAMLFWSKRRQLTLDPLTRSLIGILNCNCVSTFLPVVANSVGIRLHIHDTRPTVFEIGDAVLAVDEFLAQECLGNHKSAIKISTGDTLIPVLGALINGYIDPITFTPYYPMFLFSNPATFVLNVGSIPEYTLLCRFASYQRPKGMALPILRRGLLVLPKHHVFISSPSTFLTDNGDTLSYFGFDSFKKIAPLGGSACKFEVWSMEYGWRLAINNLVGWVLWRSGAEILASHVYGHEVGVLHNKVTVDGIVIGEVNTQYELQ